MSKVPQEPIISPLFKRQAFNAHIEVACAPFSRRSPKHPAQASSYVASRGIFEDKTDRATAPDAGRRGSWGSDAIRLALFVVFVIAGTIFVNEFVFRSFSVVGPSMENTLHAGDRLIVNRLPVTWSRIRRGSYAPHRGQIIVFENPRYLPGTQDKFIVKRVIAFGGERVTLKNGSYTVYTEAHPEGFDPDRFNHGDPETPTSGELDEVVPAGELFVSGDHRQGSFSKDSRNGLGTIPLYDVVGPVTARIFPFDKARVF